MTVEQPRPRSADFQHATELAEQERRIWKMLGTAPAGEPARDMNDAG